MLKKYKHGGIFMTYKLNRKKVLIGTGIALGAAGIAAVIVKCRKRYRKNHDEQKELTQAALLALMGSGLSSILDISGGFGELTDLNDLRFDYDDDGEDNDWSDDGYLPDHDGFVGTGYDIFSPEFMEYHGIHNENQRMVCAAVYDLMREIGKWQGNATELWDLLKIFCEDMDFTPQIIIRYLNASKEYLMEICGIEFVGLTSKDEKGKKMFMLKKNPSAA